MYQKNWDEFLELLRHKKLSDSDLLSKVGEELGAVEQWKQNKNTMTKIYPTSSNIKKMENYFNTKFIAQFKKRIKDKIQLKDSQLQEIVSFLSQFRQITFLFQFKNKKPLQSMLKSAYNEDFNVDDSLNYLNRMFDAILTRVLYLQGIAHEFILNIINVYKMGEYKFYLNLFSIILFYYDSFDEFIENLRSITDKLQLIISNFNGLLIPFLLSKLSDMNSELLRNWVDDNHRGIIITENDSNDSLADKLVLGIKAIEVMCSELENHTVKKVRILVIGQNSDVLSGWHKIIVCKMGMPMYYSNFRKIRLSSYNRKKRILIEFVRVDKILKRIHNYPFDLKQIYNSLKCNLIIIDDIGVLNKGNLRILKIPHQNLIGFAKNCENYEKIKKTTEKLGNIINILGQISSDKQKIKTLDFYMR
ncbi:MAG: hypothetical protein ACTSWY_00735 [Promethearchaeota archaeon]